MTAEATALFKYLESVAPDYRAKLIEVRDEVARWLTYIPQTFPHYTQHTVEHSEAIIEKLSKLLFYEDDPTRPVVHLSGVEAYILAVGAYLHDAGMVVSDHEKEQVLRSEEWGSWTTDGSGKKRWLETLAMQASADGDQIKLLASERQLRFLIAEFIRQRHHKRAVDVIEQHHAALGRLDFGDRVLRRTIASVCVAHGLDRSELEDNEHYPFRRDIRNQSVNVRFLAVLLRIGDLLDMRYDRACPLLSAAACPLPADSYAHWTQYQRISHEMIAPDRIELIAECATHEEHRFLYDWCNWLVEEVRWARTLMATSPRHGDWPAPTVSIGSGGSKETIVIRPSKEAKYLPGDWHFQIDSVAIFDRLIRDVYQGPLPYIRELIQNALDATRCRMYADLTRDGLACPDSPREVSADYRERYPITITLLAESIRNQLSGEEETQQVLVVDDRGIGMDKEVVQRYFLQVGKSFYTTDYFKRTFPFHPTSRFGIGFLSVFAVSDKVTVETMNTSGGSSSSAIRLTLTGPRSYLLVEQCNRKTPGTRIVVYLREALEGEQLTRFLNHLCRRVEFPIVVDDLGKQSTITEETQEQYLDATPDPTDSNSTFVIRAFPFKESGLRGEHYVLARQSPAGESWAEGRTVRNHSEKYPYFTPPKIPNYACQQGLFVDYGATSGGLFGLAYDDRGPGTDASLDRSSRRSKGATKRPGLEKIQRDLVVSHLETSPLFAGPNGWSYAHRLANECPGDWWLQVDRTTPIFIDKSIRYLPLAQIAASESFSTVCTIPESSFLPSDYKWDVEPAAKEKALRHNYWISAEHIIFFALQLRIALFAGREASRLDWLTSKSVLVTWTRSNTRTVTCTLEQKDVVGLLLHPTIGQSNLYTLNKSNDFVKWALWAVENDLPSAGRFLDRLRQWWEFKNINSLLHQYRTGPAIEFYPPEGSIERRNFRPHFR